VERLARLGVEIARELGDTALRGQALTATCGDLVPEREADRWRRQEALGLVGKACRRRPRSTHADAPDADPAAPRRLEECERELAVSTEMARSLGVPEAEATPPTSRSPGRCCTPTGPSQAAHRGRPAPVRTGRLRHVQCAG